MGSEKDREEDGSQDSSVDDQLHKVAARIANSSRTEWVKPFDFQPTSQQQSSTEIVRTPIKEEETTPNLRTPDASPQVINGQEEPIPITTGALLKEQTKKGKSGTEPNLHYGQTIKDKVILQRWRTKELADTGRTEITDQGIFIDADDNAFIVKGGIADMKARGKHNRETMTPNKHKVNPPVTIPPTQSSGPTGGLPGAPGGGPPNGGPSGGGHGSGPPRHGSRLPIPTRGIG
ncbi:hypothetical protein EDD18DRAFT_1107387 [Armillaria luteobubalina]|uniref:Uncharacterized protein n=1 Tax=Armillaria luteobubalina TaxID=153913 RepID=A0AA39TLW1_9AGAR|nr:hypothetical protein EDD18DRAFT_1107387 [Armillaria luteobubalina]